MVVAEDDVAMVVADDGQEMVVAEDDLAMVLPKMASRWWWCLTMTS